MILTKAVPFTPKEIKQLAQEFEFYIKTVIDIEKKICSAGSKMHYECEQTLLQQESEQKNLWGGGLDLVTKTIDTNAIINIRPNDNNLSSEIQDKFTREKFTKLMKYFFPGEGLE